MSRQPSTITVRGHKVSNKTNRAYVVVAVRPEPITTERGTYVAFARIEKRTDNIDTARGCVRRYGRQNGAFCVVVRSATGEEV